MKKLVILFLAIGTLFSSCQNDSEPIATELDQTGAINTTFDGVSVIAGALHFESADIYFAAANKIAGMTDVEFEAWESAIGFKSERTKSSKLEDLFEAQVNEKYSDDNIEFTFNEDEIFMPTIPSFFYRSIINEDYVFYINGIKHLIDGSSITAFSNTRSQEMLGTSDYVMTLENDTRSTRSFGGPLITHSCHKRSVWTSATMIRQVGWGPVHSGTPTVEIFVDARKGNSHYSTTYYIDRVMISGVNHGSFYKGESKNFTQIVPSGELFIYPITYGVATRGTAAHGYGLYNIQWNASNTHSDFPHFKLPNFWGC